MTDTQRTMIDFFQSELGSLAAFIEEHFPGCAGNGEVDNVTRMVRNAIVMIGCALEWMRFAMAVDESIPPAGVESPDNGDTMDVLPFKGRAGQANDPSSRA